MIYDVNGNGLIAGLAINVQDYGAKGDGTTNDSPSIQSALDAIKDTGGIVFFPVGTYALESSVLFYSKQSLIFESGAVLKQNAAINNLLMSKCGTDVTGYNGTHDCLIYGATFDGSTYTTSNTLVGLIHSKNIIIENCVFKNAYGTWHNLEINSSYNVKVINCDFEGSRKSGQNSCLIQIDAINNADTWPWPDNRGSIDGTVSKYIDISGTIFHDDTVSPAIGNHSSAVDTYIRIHDCIFDGLTTSRAAIAFGAASYAYAHDNTFVGCTTALGDNVTGYNNLINGTLT